MTMADNQIRTTVYLDENLYLTAKKKAVEERTTLTGLIQKGLKNELAKKKKERKIRKKLRLPSHNLGLMDSDKKFSREEIYDGIEF